MAARDWLRAMRHRIDALTTRISLRTKRRYLRRRVERARAKIRFAPAAPQVLEPRSLMTASPPLDDKLGDTAASDPHAAVIAHTSAPHQHAAAPQSHSVHYVGQTSQPDAVAGTSTTAPLWSDKHASGSADPLTGASPQTDRQSHARRFARSSLAQWPGGWRAALGPVVGGDADDSHGAALQTVAAGRRGARVQHGVRERLGQRPVHPRRPFEF